MVAAWECDNNHHLNVRFYHGFFEDAALHFMSAAGVPPAARPTARTRHVRYHSEMHAGQILRVESHMAEAAAPGRWHIVHRMFEPATERLSATALETYEGVAPSGVEAFAAAIPDEAAPRSLTLDPSELKASGNGIPTWRGRIEASDIDANGRLRGKSLIGLFSGSAGQMWEGVGASQPWMKENNIGRAALEMKATQGDRYAPGLAHVLFRPFAVGGRTVSFRHELYETDTGRLLAVNEVTGLLFDLKARKSISLPDDIRQKVEAMIGDGEPAVAG